MKELDKKEMKSKSLIANILDMDEDYHPATKSHTVHPCHPNYPKAPLASIFMSRSNPNLPNSFISAKWFQDIPNSCYFA